MLKLQERSYDWALEHIEKYGDTDIFPLPFEFAAIREYCDSGRTITAEACAQNQSIDTKVYYTYSTCMRCMNHLVHTLTLWSWLYDRRT